MFEDSRKRLPVVLLTSLVLWLGMLTAVGLILKRSQASQSVESAIAVGLIDLPLKGLAGGGGSTSADPSKLQTRPIEISRPKMVERHRSTPLPRDAARTRPRQ